MAAKLYVVVAAVCAAGLTAALPYHAATEHDDDDAAAADGHHSEPQHHHHHHRSYHFQYAVHDPHTGDVHSRNEVNDGHGTVRGTYSLLEADGSTRVVEYTADDEHGFKAEVKRIEPLHGKSAAYRHEHAKQPAPVHADGGDDDDDGGLHQYVPAELYSSH